MVSAIAGYRQLQRDAMLPRMPDAFKLLIVALGIPACAAVALYVSRRMQNAYWRTILYWMCAGNVLAVLIWCFFRPSRPERAFTSSAPPLMTVGLFLFVVYGILHMIVRARLVHRGLAKRGWETVGS